MTVQDLIRVLSQMPSDAVVVCDRFSDMQEQEAPTLLRAEDKLVVFRNGIYMQYRQWEWAKTGNTTKDKRVTPDEVPNFVTVCHFAGN